jgi:hypothetical protein
MVPHCSIVRARWNNTEDNPTGGWVAAVGELFLGMSGRPNRLVEETAASGTKQLLSQWLQPAKKHREIHVCRCKLLTANARS